MQVVSFRAEVSNAPGHVEFPVSSRRTRPAKAEQAQNSFSYHRLFTQRPQRGAHVQKSAGAGLFCGESRLTGKKASEVY